jgi:hypothetical protein
MHPILAGRYYGILLAGDTDRKTNKLELVDLIYKQYMTVLHYESSISFMLFMCRYLYLLHADAMLVLVGDLFTAYRSKTKDQYKTHWGVKMENELNVYLAYGYAIHNSRKKAQQCIEAVDPDLFEIFWYKQMHSDYSAVVSFIQHLHQV